MIFNKSQKIISIAYICCLISILFFLTPYTYNHDYGLQTNFGNFFDIERPILYSKLLIEMGVLSVIFFLVPVIFKSKL